VIGKRISRARLPLALLARLCTATHCNTLQYTVVTTRYNTLEHTATTPIRLFFIKKNEQAMYIWGAYILLSTLDFVFILKSLDTIV